MTVLMQGISFGESPRWHDRRVWFSDWGAHQVISLDSAPQYDTRIQTHADPHCGVAMGVIRLHENLAD
jgi:sugar lactone lactonase YvrE